MMNLNPDMENDTLTLYVTGHIDSSNAPELEEAVNQACRQYNPAKVIIDCGELTYISSAGLRVILRLLKRVSDTVLINVSPEAYEIFEVTGFTEMMEIRKAYRVLSVEGCEVVGQGANGKVYRIDKDTIVKVYLNPDSLPEIHRERELARTAFVLGVPTAIPYDVVRIEGGGYGSVFEMLNARNLGKLLIQKEKTMDEVVKMSVDLLKVIHSTVVSPDSMPDMKATALNWAEFLKDYLPEEQYTKLHDLIEAVPEDHHMMHGDYHLKNVMLQGDEVLLIDMDTLCWGHPVFELGSMYNAYGGYSEVDHSVVENFLGIPYDDAVDFWHRSLRMYLGTEDEERIKEVEDKARIIGYTRNMRRTIRRNGFEEEEGRKVIENCREQLAVLLQKYDTLTF